MVDAGQAPVPHLSRLRAPPRRRSCALAFAATLLSSAPGLGAGPSLTEDLGEIERVALDRALRARGLELDPAPRGKRLAAIHVVNLDVLQPEDGFLQLFNALHVTTQEDVIRREVLLLPGMVWSEAKVFETKRNLRDRTFTTAVVAVPVKNLEPARVDLLVVTRDVWSLRLETSANFQQDELQRLRVALVENNLFGRRKRLGVELDMDQGATYLGGSFFDSNIRGSRLTFYHGSGIFLSRDTQTPEGSASDTIFRLPLWALDREFGFDAQVTHAVQVVRSFVGSELRTYEAPGASLPWVYRSRSATAQLSATRSFPGTIIHRISAGYALSWQEVEPSLPGDTTAEDRAAFARDVLPRSETRSGLALGYRVFVPEFRIYRNIQTFDFPEDQQVGPDVRLSVTGSPSFFGSTVDSLLFESSARWFFAWSDDAYSVLSGSSSHRLEEDGLIDNLVSVGIYTASETLFGWLRVIASVRGAALFAETTNRFLAIGGDDGLRGFPVGQFTGDRRLSANLELRTHSVKLWFFELGAVAFYDGGHAFGTRPGLPAATTAAALAWQSNAGVGLRYLVPMANTTVWRIDLAVPFTGAQPGFPGTRFSFALGQFF